MFHPGDAVKVTILEDDQACFGPVEYRGLVVEWYDGTLLGLRAGERGGRMVVNTNSLYFIKAEAA